MAPPPRSSVAAAPDPAAYLGLGGAAAECICVCTQPELCTASLTSLGFLETLAEESDVAADCLRARTWPSDGAALLVLAPRGGDAAKLQQVCRALLDNESTPRLFVVLAPPEAAGPCSADDAAVSAALQETLIGEGCDDVFNLELGEKLTSRRVRCAILRAEKVQRRIRETMAAMKREAESKVRVADRRFLWSLPGQVLGSIPPVDRSLDKPNTPGAPGGLAGVKDLAFDLTLGAGSYGTVYMSNHPVRGPLAVKSIPKETVKDTKSLVALDHEFGIMRSLPPHPNVVRAWEALHGQSNLYLVMSYAGRRPLHDYHMQLTQKTGAATLPEAVADDFCRQELRAVAHLHANSICHRDLKPANFILSDDCKTLKLADFGLAVPICGPGQLLNSVCGSLPFVAPEILELRTTGQRYDGLLADCWSLSMNLYELLCGPYSVEKQLGWVPRSPGSIAAKIRDLKAFGGKAKRSLPGMVHSSLGATILGMLEVSPRLRLMTGQARGPGEEDA